VRTLSETEVWEALAEVPDPEIPVVSVVDLGLVHAVELDGERLRVELLPTFVGCPALELIRRSVAERLAGMAPQVEVEMTLAVPWTSDRITDEGRRKLRESGFAPPDKGSESAFGRRPGDSDRQSRSEFTTIITPPRAACPHCGSADTTLENLFGPTLCRTLFWCNRCRQPYEQFKAV
jgi:ring-1,2-phenylacetyl-CoA epoxidase subunit PaaD